MSNPFATPAAASGGVDLKELLGALLIIEPLSLETDIQTSYGATDAIRATIHVVDGPNGGNTHEDSLLFPKVLQSQLRSRIGEKVLGRLGQGQAKSGQSAPWILEEATPADVQAGTEFLNKQQASTLSTPGGTPPF